MMLAETAVFGSEFNALAKSLNGYAYVEAGMRLRALVTLGETLGTDDLLRLAARYEQPDAEVCGRRARRVVQARCTPQRPVLG